MEAAYMLPNRTQHRQEIDTGMPPEPAVFQRHRGAHHARGRFHRPVAVFHLPPPIRAQAFMASLGDETPVAIGDEGGRRRCCEMRILHHPNTPDRQHALNRQQAADRQHARDSRLGGRRAEADPAQHGALAAHG
jgi:hypothetical protein